MAVSIHISSVGQLETFGQPLDRECCVGKEEL